MAACANGAAYKKCPPLQVARDFNRADKRTGILKRAAGGAAPLESGLDSHLNFGMGHGKNFFSTTPLMGHAMSGTPLGGKRFAEGGKVSKPAKPAGPSAKERREIREIVERGKQDAVETLRASRDALLSMRPMDATVDTKLAGLRDRLMKADGGAVVEEPSAAEGDPVQLYQEYLDLLAQLENPELEPQRQAESIDRLAEIERALEAMGINVAEGQPSQ